MEELFQTRHYEPRVLPTRSSGDVLHINFSVATWQIVELVSRVYWFILSVNKEML